RQPLRRMRLLRLSARNQAARGAVVKPQMESAKLLAREVWPKETVSTPARRSSGVSRLVTGDITMQPQHVVEIAPPVQPVDPASGPGREVGRRDDLVSV